MVGLASGCATISRDTASLSVEIGGMISSSRQSHLNLLDEYINERRARIEYFMHNEWIPQFLQSFVKKVDLEKEICGNIESYDSALVLRDFTEAASKRVIERRYKLSAALDDIERELRMNINNHYNNLERANNALTANLRSFRENEDFRDKIIKQLKLKPGKLPFEKLSKRLDGLMK